MLKAKEHCCEEAALGMGDAYIPCNKPATKIIRPRKDGGEPDLRMCDFCADHSLRNRGMILVGPYVNPTPVKQDYSYWRDALAGKKPKMFVDSPELGFYRKGVYVKEPNVRSKRVGWTPVAIFLNDPKSSELTAVIGPISNPNMIVDRDKINELWSYVAGNPISEETYRAVAERGEGWPDSHDAAPALPEGVSFSPVEGVTAYNVYDNVPADQSPAEKIAAAVKADQALAVAYRAIDSDELASKARSLQNRFLEHRGEAAKAYEAANRPLLDQQKALREVWFPIRDDADAEIKALAKAMAGWEDVKRAAAKLAQEAAANAAREHAEAVRKAEEANKPAPPPPVEVKPNTPAPPPPVEVKPNTPAPSVQIRGGAGRAASVSLQKFVTSVDAAKVFEQFKTNAEVIELLTALAQKAIRAGLDVPGAKWEERSVVR